MEVHDLALMGVCSNLDSFSSILARVVVPSH